MTLNSFVPVDQDLKLATIRAAAPRLLNSFKPPVQPAPSDKDMVEAIRKTAADVKRMVVHVPGSSADAARRVSDLLIRISDSDAVTRVRLKLPSFRRSRMTSRDFAAASIQSR